ncbi:hypothetical protein [Candidatus Nitrososphaera sp. FF02]|uniref:hypothetical protein n=1 Tax=Candidatus Nitrososphaera sp. FF02 TaxID=3398226 RepID=UPI0039E9558C
MPIHKKTLEAFREKGLLHEVDAITGQEREMEDGDHRIQFIQGIGQGNQYQNHATWYRLLAIAEDRGVEPEERILTANRVVGPEGKDHCLFTYQISCMHYDGSTVLNERYTGYGKYYLPVWRRKFNGLKQRFEETDEVAGATTHWQFPFTGEKMKIESPVTGKEIPIDKLLTGESRFYITADNNKKYVVSRQDWMSMTRKQLLAKYGSENPQAQALTELTAAITKAQNLVDQK